MNFQVYSNVAYMYMLLETIHDLEISELSLGFLFCSITNLVMLKIVQLKTVALTLQQCE